MQAYLKLGVSVLIATAECGKDQERARQQCLLSLLKAFKSTGVHALVLDSRADRDHLDRRYIKQVITNRQAPLDLGYQHRIPSDEPLLGLPDAFVWCWGVGGRWRTMVAHLVVREFHT